MKKLVLASLVGLSLSSAAAFAEDPIQVVEFRGVITKDIAGDKTAITGLNGGVVANGELKLQEDGSFVTTTNVSLEHHLRDDVDSSIILEDLVPTTDWAVTQLQYFVNGTKVVSNDLTLTDTASGTDLAVSTAGSLATTNLVGDTTAKLDLSVAGTAMTDTAELDLVQPGINQGVVYATVTAKQVI